MGQAHVILRNLSLSLEGEANGNAAAALALGPNQLSGMSGENILAGHKRRFLLPWPQEIPFGPIQASFQFDGAVAK